MCPVAAGHAGEQVPGCAAAPAAPAAAHDAVLPDAVAGAGGGQPWQRQERPGAAVGSAHRQEIAHHFPYAANGRRGAAGGL